MQHTASTPLRFALFGRLRLAGDDHATLDLAGQEAAKLLAYLLLHRDRPHWREHLANESWEDGSRRDSLKHLRHALWKLHTAVPSLRPLIRAEREWIHFDARDAWIDVAAFERSFAEARDQPGFDLDPTCTKRLRAAASLHTGELLIGWDLEWCVLERERLETVFLHLLDKLMDHALQQALPEVGLGYGAASLAVDPARESTHQRLMGLHYLGGDRTAALRQYDRCARRLWDDLAVRPGRRTESLREAIEADRGAQVLTSLRARFQPIDDRSADGLSPDATAPDHPNQRD